MVQKVLRKLSQWFWKGFLNWYDGGGENGITSKRRFGSWSVFLLLEYRLPLYLKRLLELFFFFLFFFLFFFFQYISLFFLCSISWGFWWYLRRKITSSKISFQMKWYGHNYGYTGGGRIFRNGVMHTNIAKPWLWRWRNCTYIGGGCIFHSGGMHANLCGWG
jgi:hypothetical protein